MTDTQTAPDTGAVRTAGPVPEWRIVPTIPHPDPDVTERYTTSPGPADGLTKQTARDLARGRNRAGEPSPQVTWTAEPTGDTKHPDDLL
jgi:hypothetical protein